MKIRAAATVAGGLNKTQEDKYADKLVSANLSAEKGQALKLKAEAKAALTSQPAKAKQLAAVATDRLALISDEQRQRALLAAARLANGTTGDQFAASLRLVPQASLAQRQQQLEAKVRAGTAPADAPVRLLGLGREQFRREAVADGLAAQREAGRLAAVKKTHAQALTGKSPAELTREQKAEHGRLSATRQALGLAQQQLASATTPAARSAATARVATAERDLRSGYARAAVIDSLAPVRLDPKMLHDYADSLKSLPVPKLNAMRAELAQRQAGMQQGSIRGTREQLRLAEVQLAIIDGALKKKGVGPVGPIKPIDATRNPGNVVFDGPGMMVANAQAFSAPANAAKMKAAGVTYVMLQIHNNGPVGDNVAALQAGWADQWRAQGIKVGFWGVSYGNAAADAKLAAQLSAQYKADFYVADCEGSFQAGEGDPARNKQFVDAFQAEATALGIGKIPRALSSMGRVALDMKPWIDNGWDAMPQAYMNSWQHYTPTASVKFYEDWGWPKDRIHPTIATYDPTGEGGNQTVPQHISNYVPELKASGTKGFSFYLPESYLDDAEYQQLLAGMAQGMNG